MRLRKAIKKIVALGTGTTMIGATLLGATAADLSNYPSPFVKDGVFNGKIVVGAQAAAQDVIGSIEIATSLQTKSVVTTQIPVDGSSATTQLIGDSFRLDKASDKLNFQQLIRDPVQIVTGDDLDALAGGSISNQHGTFSYDQFIVLSENVAPTALEVNASVVYGIDDMQSDDPATYLFFPIDTRVYTYRLSFPTALETDVDSDGKWKDLTNKRITLLGTEYTIINTNNATGMIELMGGAIQDTMAEYTKKTYTLNGVEYEIEVVAISTREEVMFKVNGQITDKYIEGDTIRLADGTELGIRSILVNDGTEAGGSDLVTFYLGASKVVLTDANFASGSTGTLKVGSTTINDVVVDIVGEKTGSRDKISKIEIYWTADDNYYVPVGGMLSDRLSTTDKDKLFLRNLDFKFAALQTGHKKTIDINSAGTDDYKMAFTTKTGGSISETMFYVDAADAASGNLSLGARATQPYSITGQDMERRTRFSLSTNKFSHLMEVGTFQVADGKVSFTDIGTGESQEISVTGSPAAGTLYLDGYAYGFTADMTNRIVNFTSLGSDGAGTFWTPEEFKIQFSIVNGAGGTNRGNITIHEYKQSDPSGDVRDNIQVLIVGGDASTDTTIDSVTSTSTGFAWQSWDSRDRIQTAYTKYGTHLEYDTDGQNALKIDYGDEAFAEVFITSGVVQTSSTGGTTGGTVTQTTVNPIQVGSAVLDTEVADVTRDNYISVGGPCANSVSARLVGVAQSVPECLSGLSLAEGEGVVKLFENGGYVSMLVAGATALDSQRASRVVANYDDYPDTFRGMEISVTGTSLSDITVSAPTQAD